MQQARPVGSSGDEVAGLEIKQRRHLATHIKAGESWRRHGMRSADDAALAAAKLGSGAAINKEQAIGLT